MKLYKFKTANYHESYNGYDHSEGQIDYYVLASTESFARKKLNKYLRMKPESKDGNRIGDGRRWAFIQNVEIIHEVIK